MSEAAQPPSPHVLIFPFPAQGHVNSMLKLSELLCLAGGINITYLVCRNIRDLLLRHTDVEARFSKYPGFRLEALPEGIYEGKMNTDQEVVLMYDSLRSVAKPFLRELLLSPKTANPITSIVSDGILSVALDVAQETGVPIIYFRTISACAFWAYFSIPQLIQAGEIPFSGKDMDAAIENVKGMEGFLRRRDLPSFCRVSDIKSSDFVMVLDETAQTPRASGLILNTFDDLEGPILSHIRNHCPNLYTIGPLHAHLKHRLAARTNSSPAKPSTNSLWEEDGSCINWLDEQPPKSVLYVSFGSVTVLTREQLVELWHGLVDSQVRFLWVVRPDLIRSKNECNDDDNDDHRQDSRDEEELERATRERGYTVGWAPQEEVLAHQAVGGFWTHSGWNSTLEGVLEGVPMICWPYFADQQVNSRFVGEVWKVGLDMKDTCDRVIVENMVRDVMADRKDEFLKRADQMAKMARKAIEDGGSSSENLDRLIDDIRMMCRI